MKEFITTLKDSLYSPSFYAVMGSRSKREGLRYFLSLMFSVSFVIIIVVSIDLVPGVIRGVSILSDLMVSKYPSDLVVNFSGGYASTTESRAYTFPLPRELFNQSELNSFRAMGHENALVIDTRANFENASQFNNARTLVLMTRNSTVASKKDGGYEVKPFPPELNLTVNKEVVESWSRKILPTVRIALPFIIIFGLIGVFVFHSIFYFIFALISALLMWPISIITKRPGKFGEFLTMALFAVSVSVLVDLALFILGAVAGVSPLRTILLTIFVWAINTQIWKEPIPPALSTGIPLPEVKVEEKTEEKK